MNEKLLIALGDVLQESAQILLEKVIASHKAKIGEITESDIAIYEGMIEEIITEASDEFIPEDEIEVSEPDAPVYLKVASEDEEPDYVFVGGELMSMSDMGEEGEEGEGEEMPAEGEEMPVEPEMPAEEMPVEPEMPAEEMPVEPEMPAEEMPVEPEMPAEEMPEEEEGEGLEEEDEKVQGIEESSSLSADSKDSTDEYIQSILNKLQLI